ncbi:hypothetical protein OH77DRAFT_1172279 [Trametes cingulata]|nr:hypothetical protein OH77DRAFT_1172279 [Trametes cingulata]
MMRLNAAMPSSRNLPAHSLRQRCPGAIKETVRGRLFGYGYSRPRSVNVKLVHYFARSGRHAYLVAEEILGITPFIHDCRVRISGSTFRIYFTRHRVLPPNLALLSIHASRPWHGQMLVVRLDETSAHEVNLKRGDISRIDKIASRFMEEVCNRSRIPEVLHFGPIA